MSDLAEEILATTFATTRFRAGYAMDDVDDFLEGLKNRRPAASTGPTQPTTEASPPPPTQRSDSSTVPEPTLPTSTGGLRSWLFGRR